MNELNGIFLRLSPQIGKSLAGLIWIQVPEEGVPADLLQFVRNALGNRDQSAQYYTPIDVEEPNWNGVRRAMEISVVKKLNEDLEKASKWRSLVKEFFINASKDSHGYYGVSPVEFGINQTEIIAYEKERVRRETEKKEITAYKEAVNEKLATELEAEIIKLCDAFEKSNTVDTTPIEALCKKLPRKYYQECWKLPMRNPAESRVKAAYELAGKRKDEIEAEKEKLFFVNAKIWIAEHGSERLKKIVELGLLDKSLGVYYSERLTNKLGAKWEFETGDEDWDKRINPELDELQALDEAKKISESATLYYQARTKHTSDCGDGDEYCENEDHIRRSCISMDTPFETLGKTKKTVVTYLSATRHGVVFVG
jgi:hypothetical protein